jgi:predicted amino acid dehydrogenase
MKTLLREIRLILHSVRDLVIRLLPNFSDGLTYKYAFLVHPRNINDVYRKYPLFKLIPKNILEFLLRHYWPVILSHVTGVRSQKTGKEIDGIILTIPLTARQMMEDRKLALKKITQAVRLAEKNGVKLIGLGGLTSSLTKGGLDLIGRTKVDITTGHAYTAFNVTETLFKLSNIVGLDKETALVAIVGAAGSVGSTSAKLIARKGYKNMLLIDLERKHIHFQDLIEEIKKLNPETNVSTSHQIRDVKNSDLIITATNAPEALIKVDDLKNGAIVIDDAQPSDISPEVLTKDNVLVVEAGVVHTPGILSHFNFNLKDRYDNFCCMAEVLILASLEHKGNYVINRATISSVDEVSEQGRKLGFRVGEFQNFIESIRQEKISHIANIIKERKKYAD